MAISNGLYGPFALSVQYVQDMDILKTCPCCYVSITSYGKKLPEAVELCNMYGDAYERSLIFLLDESNQGEVVEINLQNIMEQMNKPTDSVYVEHTRKNDYLQFQKIRSVIQFRNPEHPVMTMCIRGNETIHIYCHLPGKTNDLVVVIKFIVSGYRAQMIVVNQASKKKKINICVVTYISAEKCRSITSIIPQA